MRTREAASEGYRRAFAALQGAAPPRRVDPAVTEAVDWQNRLVCALSARTFPGSKTVPDEQPGPIEAARAQRRRTAAAEAAALRRARAERAARHTGTTAVVARPAPPCCVRRIEQPNGPGARVDDPAGRLPPYAVATGLPSRQARRVRAGATSGWELRVDAAGGRRRSGGSRIDRGRSHALGS
ncbi:hypothetical protein GCM10010406_41280 [Streptomyces thermolineatus]|uniref:Uncharacterized protein n=1 Tax=Streptomyces thermolineatus TaxID=44033 RepID=A0ABP5ZNM9_9ACTN